MKKAKQKQNYLTSLVGLIVRRTKNLPRRD